MRRVASSMPSRARQATVAASLISLAVGSVIACHQPPPGGAAAPAAKSSPEGQRPSGVLTGGGTIGGTPLVLHLEEGERRVRRMAAKGPFILKVDRQNGGSPDLVMGYEELAPSVEIQLHRHVVADEILFVHRGTGTVYLDDRESAVRAGTTVYIPRDVTVRLVNTGPEPLGLAFVFSRPGFEELMRDNSVREGEPVVPLTAAERAVIQARHRWHTIAGERQP